MDLQPTSVTVLVDTTIPVVCAAAYGSTTGYGQLATDTDMAGSGHQDHHPSLANLQPNTTYHIRLQGVGPDGSLYQSRDYTIQTPPGSVLPQATPAPNANAGDRPSGDNLALLAHGGRITGVSSNFGGGGNASTYGANNAIDGDPTTQWSSNGDGDNAWIEITLASETEVTAIGFQTRTMGASAQILSFQVVTDLAETYGPFTLSDASRVYYFSFPRSFRASKLRFEAVQTNGGNTGAAELEVYGLVDGM
ncbi:MAG: discoidin domain-containing protein [Chloroflexi bacterium]|nr:discoidin domain-containing protein [Chloroflexota bacterium]